MKLDIKMCIIFIATFSYLCLTGGLPVTSDCDKTYCCETVYRRNSYRILCYSPKTLYILQAFTYNGQSYESCDLTQHIGVINVTDAIGNLCNDKQECTIDAWKYQYTFLWSNNFLKVKFKCKVPSISGNLPTIRRTISQTKTSRSTTLPNTSVYEKHPSVSFTTINATPSICDKTQVLQSCCSKIYKLNIYKISCNSPNTLLILKAFTYTADLQDTYRSCDIPSYVPAINVTKRIGKICNDHNECIIDALQYRYIFPSRHDNFLKVKFKCKVPPRRHPSPTTRPVVLHTNRHHHTDKDVIRLHHVTTNAIIYQTTSPQKNVIISTQHMVSSTQRIIVPTNQRQRITDLFSSITTRRNQTNANLIDGSDQETVTIVGSVCGTIVVMLLSVFLIFIIRKRICFSQPTKNRPFRHTRNNPGYDLHNDFTPIDKPKPITQSNVVYNAKDTPERVNIGDSVQQRESEKDVYTYANLALIDTDFDKKENLHFTVNREITSTYDHGYFLSTADDNDAYDHKIHGSVLPNNNDNTYDHTIRTTGGRDIDGTYDHNFGPTTDDDYDVTGSYKRSGNYDSNYTGYDSYQ